MNYTGQTWNQYLTSVVNNPFAQTLFYAVLVAVTLVIVARVWGQVAKWVQAPSAPRTARLSRETKRALIRDGYGPQLNKAPAYRNSAARQWSTHR